MRTQIISVPDLKEYEGKVAEGIEDGFLRTTSVTAPTHLLIGVQARCQARGILASMFTRFLSEINHRLDARGIMFPGPDADAALKDIVENELTPSACKAYEPHSNNPG